MESRKIKITNVINPNKFYFKFDDSNTSNLLKKLESDIQESLGNKQNCIVTQIIEGEIYVFHHKQWDRWLRVRVDKSIVQNHRPQIILWLIDYGFPYKTDQVKRLSTINNEFKTELNVIYSGCIDVLPTKTYFDHASNETKLMFSHEWSQVAIDFMENFINNATHLRFHKYGSKGVVNFGEMTATDEFELTYSLKKMLVAQKFAISCPASKLVENLQKVDLKPLSYTRKKDQNVESMPSVLNKKNELSTAPDFLKTCAEFNFEKIYLKVTNTNEEPKQMAERLEIKVPKKTTKVSPKSTATFLPAGSHVQDYLTEDINKSKIMPQKEAKNVQSVPIKLPRVLIKPQSIPKSLQNPPIKQQSGVIEPQIPNNTMTDVREVENNFKNLTLDKAIVCASDVHRVLVHGKFISKPIDKLHEFNFSDTMYKSMKAINFQVFRIQSYTWGNILNGKAMVIVNVEKSGQTFSYLPAILDTVTDDCEKSTNKNLCGPSCIIIVRSSRDVENLYNISKKLLTSESPVKILKASGNNDENTVVQLLNGCDIFITTPRCFYRITNSSYVKLFDVKRIKNLVFDGLDSMLKLWQTDIQLIIKTCTKGTKHPEENPQIIVTSNVWHHQIKNIMNLSCEPIVCIGNYIEAAAYAGSKFALEKCATMEEKALKLCSRLKDESYMYRRTMVIVNNQTEIAQLVNYLKSCSIIFSTVDEHSTREDIASKNISWGCQVIGKFSLMVVQDSVVPQITFNSVQYLYHFSLPSTWTRFSYRFTVSYDYYLKYLDSKDNVNENTDQLPCTTILLDDENLNEIPRLIDFMLTHRLADIPKMILDFVENICFERERKKLDSQSGSFVTLCPNIFQFGECAKKVYCSYRHVFTFEDHAMSHLPFSGQIKFQLVDCLDPTMYKIKILEHRSENSKTWISRKKELEYGEECMKLMQSNYAVKENQIMKHPVKVDDLCAVFDSKDVAWYRCIVKEKKQQCTNYFFARVLLIDIGRTINVKSSDLMILPPKFLQFAPQVTDLQVLNIIPNDFEDFWHQEITNDLKTKLGKEPKNSYYVCSIQLAIRNTLFTENFEIKHELSGLGIDLSNYDLKKDLIKRNQCSIDPLISKKLKNLATACNLIVAETPKDITLNVVPKSIPIAEPKITEVWKHLHWKNDYQVLLKDFNNPEDFYVILADPKKKIQEIEVFEPKDTLTNVVTGAVYLARKNDGLMKRVKIMHQIEDEILVECFQLDFGETLSYRKDELYEIPLHLVEFFPFQAIHCRMVGICPLYKMDTWTKASINAVYKTLKSGAEILKMHVLKNNEKHLKNDLLQINSYDVLLFDSESGQRYDELLIQMRFAVPDEIASKIVIDDSTEDPEDWNNVNEESGGAFLKEIETKTTTSNDFLSTLNSDDIDCQIDENELLTMLGFPGGKVVIQEKGEIVYPFEKLKSEQETLPKEVENVLVDETKENTIDLVEPQQQFKNIPALSCSLKHPKIEWRQTDVLIYLKISATDCVNYSLKINSESMSIILKYKDSFESAIVYFFGCLDASLSSHELRGLNVTVRLAKKIAGKTWPRLTKHPEKNHAIKYCTDEINLLTEEKLISGVVTNKPMYRPDDSDYEDYSSDSSHEDDEFEGNHVEEPFYRK